MNNSKLEHALSYAARGWCVLPVRPRSKIPALKNWTEEASCDVNTVTRMFHNHTGNIGVVCGAGSGIVVIDVDLPDGPETLKALETELGPLSPTLKQRTGNNGQHLIFQYPQGHTIRGTQGAQGRGLGKGLDVRGEGSQIVVAPSIHENGQVYAWENNLPIADLPSAWITRLESQAPQAAPVGQERRQQPPGLSLLMSGLRHPYVQAAVQSELTKGREVPKGERNVTLFRAACSVGGWIPDGHLTQEEAHSLLFQAAEENGYVADDGADAANKTITSGLNTGMARPREIPTTPPGFSIITGGQHPGLWYTEPAKNDDDEPQRIWLGQPLNILGLSRDESSNAWGILLKWSDPDGVEHTWTLPCELLAGSDPAAWRGQLAHGGWVGAAGKRERDLLFRYLNSSQPARRILQVARTGWHDGTFVLPDKNICPNGVLNSSIILNNSANNNPYSQSGSLDAWRETVGAMAEGNSRLTLALCASLASVFLELAGQESGGFNFIGSSSTGKTTALLAAASVWGKGTSADGYTRSWRSTSNALEVLAAVHSDSLLCLDELAQAPAQVVAEAAYMLGNGQGKARANQKGNARPIKHWRCMILSSGEQSLEAKLREENKRAHAGQAVRMVDIPADAGCGLGLFENLHGHMTPQSFADAIRQAAARNYGHAAREFIQNVVAQRDRFKTLHEEVSRVAVAMAKKADAQVQRVAKRFALCLIAGELATNWGILPWKPGSATSAIRTCFNAWLSYRGGAGATEDMQIIRQVTLFIEQHGISRFQPLTPNSDPLFESGAYHNRAGFRDTKNGRVIYYVLLESFASEVCKGFDARKAAQVLRGAGILTPGDGQRLQAKPPRDLPGWGRKRCYALAFDLEKDAEE